MDNCSAITKKSASNLALAFFLLPKAKRDAMAALYAFCREVDDVADDESVPVDKRRASLAAWREDIRRACSGQEPRFPVNRELQPVVAQFKLPFAHFDELIRGVEMDLDTNRYATIEELELYCYRVASVVGLLSIEVFGYTQPACREYAVRLGKALQLTNILRDVRNDAQRGRVYLPLEELKRFEVTPEEILNYRYSERFERLAQSLCKRARDYYDSARAVLPEVDRPSMVAAELMAAVYWSLLDKLEARRFDVFGPMPVKLSKPAKLTLAFGAWLRFVAARKTMPYGTQKLG